MPYVRSALLPIQPSKFISRSLGAEAPTTNPCYSPLSIVPSGALYRFAAIWRRYLPPQSG
jgi:hypothetical protein